VENPLAAFLILLDAEEAPGVGVEAVEAQLVLDPEQDEQGAGHAQGQAGHVEKGIALVPPDGSEGDFKIALEHRSFPFE
jgi:hypothetical protein